MLAVPPRFLERMQAMLKDEFPAFQAIYSQPPVTGLRVNTLKIPADEFAMHAGFPLDPLFWAPSGFVLMEEVPGLQPGKHPYHAAGLYYLQDPSAMAVAGILDPQPGEAVLDLAAAPGGKATHIASLMHDRGLLVANELHPKRVWDLAENLERWGVHNCIITNETPQNLADHFGAFFDRVLVDAPCSGEGMFRKSQSARNDWSPSLVQSCAVRQLNILHQAARLVKPGGLLVYTTCTFSPEENEGVVARFLQDRLKQGEAIFESVPNQKLPFASSGRPDCLTSVERRLDPSMISAIQNTVRLWPHLGYPEGHFIALMRRVDEGAANAFKPEVSRVPRQALTDFMTFCHHHLIFEPGELRLEGGYLYQIPEGLPPLGKLRLVRPGWWLGEVKTNRFEPSHALAMGLPDVQFHQRIEFDPDFPLLVRYFQGEVLDLRGADGWLPITVRLGNAGQTFPVGWGKRSGGRIKNYYPRGLRWV